MKFSIRLAAFLLLLTVNFAPVASEGSEETTEAAAAEESSAAAEEVTTEEPATTEAPAEESTAEAASPSEVPKTKPKPQPTPKQSSDTCSPWPAHLRSVRDCCNIPHNPASISLNTCFYRCSSRELDERRQVECAASCFVNVTGIVAYDGRLNRDRIKNMYIGTMMSNERWTRVIEAAVDRCDIAGKGSLHADLARFFACLNDHMAEQCVHFVQSSECERTQEQFEQCNHVKPNCDHWPVGLGSPEMCCRVPPLFAHRLVEKCRYECEHKELFAQRQLKCNEACLYNDTRLRVEGRFNFDVVKELLMNSANFLPEWKKPVNEAVEKCRGAIGYQHDQSGPHHQSPSLGVNYEITTLQTCLRDHLVNNCVEFKDEGFCKRVKNFAKKCPDTRPRRVVNYHYQEVRVQQGGR